jgi:hypothetical protein
MQDPIEGMAPPAAPDTGTPAPDTQTEAFDWTAHADKEIDIPGFRSMKLGDLVNERKGLNDTIAQAKQSSRQELDNLRQEYEAKYGWANELSPYFNDPNWMQAYQSLPWQQQGYAGTTQGAAPPMAPDPQVSELMQKVNFMEQKEAGRQIDADFDQLRANDYPLDEEMKMTVLEEATASGIHDVQAVYWKLYADKAIAHKQSVASKKTAEKMNANNETYERLPSQSVSSAAPASDVASMKDSEWRAAATSRLASFGKIV